MCVYTSHLVYVICKKYLNIYITYSHILQVTHTHVFSFFISLFNSHTFVVLNIDLHSGVSNIFFFFRFFFKSKIITNLYQYQCSMFTHTYIKAYYLYASFISTSSVDTVESPNAVFK